MKVSELTELIPILEGLRNGRTLQMSDPANPNRWEDVVGDKYLELSFPPKCYRLKPEPKLRGFSQADVFPLIGKAVFRVKRIAGACEPGNLGLLVGACSEFLYFSTGRDATRYDYAVRELEWTDDAGKTWHPCGVMEGAQ